MCARMHNAYVHTYMHTYIQHLEYIACKKPRLQLKRTHVHSYIHTYIHICIHACSTWGRWHARSPDVPSSAAWKGHTLGNNSYTGICLFLFFPFLFFRFCVICMCTYVCLCVCVCVYVYVSVYMYIYRSPGVPSSAAW